MNCTFILNMTLSCVFLSKSLVFFGFHWLITTLDLFSFWKRFDFFIKSFLIIQSSLEQCRGKGHRSLCSQKLEYNYIWPSVYIWPFVYSIPNLGVDP